MGHKPPTAIAKAGIETGATEARLAWGRALVARFLAGAPERAAEPEPVARHA